MPYGAEADQPAGALVPQREPGGGQRAAEAERRRRAQRLQGGVRGAQAVARHAGIEVVEVNPILDRENETARLAVELVASALGARIL